MMAVYENLLRRLCAAGVYSADAPILNAELKAYAGEIERLYTDLGQMFRERFITTAEDEGLRVYEELFGPERSGESAESRREMLLLRMNLGGGDFTPAGIRRALDSLGLQYVVSEFPALQKLNIIATTDYSEAQQAWIQREVSKIVPAHLEFEITYNSLTWAQWDAMNRTFGAIDSEDQSWHDIDRRTE